MAPRPRTIAVAAATTQTTSLGAPNCFTASTSFSPATHGPPTQLFSSDYHTPNVHSRRLLDLRLLFCEGETPCVLIEEPPPTYARRSKCNESPQRPPTYQFHPIEDGHHLQMRKR